jgi:putative transposase
MAILHRNSPTGVVHHSDRRVQSLCVVYVEKLNSRKFHISCSSKKNPKDNAWTESFMKTLKHEEIFMGQYGVYLDVVYNKKRLHSILRYLPLEECEEMVKMKYQGDRTDRPEFKI